MSAPQPVAAIRKKLSRALTALDTADQQEPTVEKAKSGRLHDKIAAFQEQMKALKDIEVQLNKTGDKQISYCF